ncbi:MAG TPA: hypothetical protein VFX12_12840 [Vicinamibacterales bacterium]|nr:hypothetical protein [Vicinamibacterales bacterium]
MKPRLLFIALAVFAFASIAAAQQPPFAAGAGGQMPDPKQISGVPLPVGNLPVGTVTVRVVLGQLDHPLAKQSVALTGAGAPQSASTDDSGHAQFDALAPGTQVQAHVTVNGERIDSQTFEVPAQGGIRLMLVATDPAAAQKAAEAQKLAKEPPIKGIVVLGDQTRFVVELGDDGLNVYNIVQIMNTARRAVDTGGPLVFNLPAEATGTTLLEGSSSNALASGTQVTVNGPFPPGATLVQFAYAIPYGRDTIAIAERMPAELSQVTLLLQKTKTMRLASPDIVQQREMSADGQSYVLGQGPALKAGSLLTMTVSGVPHHPVWPRNLALALAGVILLGGGWVAVRGRRGAESRAARRRRLQAERERLFAELAVVEARHRAGGIDDEDFALRRRDLIAALEDVYAAMDEEAAA